jgi:hypothetical protein
MATQIPTRLPRVTPVFHLAGNTSVRMVGFSLRLETLLSSLGNVNRSDLNVLDHGCRRTPALNTSDFKCATKFAISAGSSGISHLRGDGGLNRLSTRHLLGGSEL